MIICTKFQMDLNQKEYHHLIDCQAHICKQQKLILKKLLLVLQMLQVIQFEQL